jgi:hypothetical protein
MLDVLLLADTARQVFEGQKTVTTASGTARVTTTSKQGLRKVEFSAGDERLVGGSSRIPTQRAAGRAWLAKVIR